MRTMQAIAAASLFFAATAAHGERTTGSNLQAYCAEAGTVRSGTYGSGLCHGYITGVFEAVRAFLDTVCLPEGVTRNQILRVVERYLENNPEALQQRAVALTTSALMKEWPCEPPETSR